MMGRIIFDREPSGLDGYCLGLQQDFENIGSLAVWDLESSTKETVSFRVTDLPEQGRVETPYFLINQQVLHATGF